MRKVIRAEMQKNHLIGAKEAGANNLPLQNAYCDDKSENQAGQLQ
jgi:hypothetical protein